ncbi:hypothetical protein [Caballeronia novacaledonica]|uniref:Lipoprotein n=1 Tax=Caballeronia novacaledonica TaxID=1544861 RepID=A0AA37MVC2_9BURK|nr:hypothetical protein [Caballeronia novacaledonica]GJH30747.1 hypothetical protein CBA19CS42_39545 [Caballeronia novacaledonica]
MNTAHRLALLFLIAITSIDTFAQGGKPPDGEFVTVDGVTYWKPRDSRGFQPPIKIPLPYAKQAAHEDALTTLWPEAKKTIGYFIEGSRMGDARAKAEERIAQRLRSGDKMAAVMVLADQPLDLKGQFKKRAPCG